MAALASEADAVFQSSDYKLTPKITISENTSEVFCVRFSPDGKYVAAGCGDGAIRVFNASNGQFAYNLQGGSNVALPCTAIRFRPVSVTTRTKNVFIAANAAGCVQHWHMTSSKCLHNLEDPENQIYAVDYNEEGSKFVTCGKDTAVRVYDEATKTELVKMQGGMGYSSRTSPGHSNRIFSCKVLRDDENIVVTGGWDNTVQIWDIRSGVSVRSIFGPHICGDALDVVGNKIVTGSWRPENQLETWDLTTCQKIDSIPWTIGEKQTMLYAAQFSKEDAARNTSAMFIGAGGSGTNEAKVFDTTKDNAVVGTVTGLKNGIFALDFSPTEQKIAIAGGDASIRILDIEKSSDVP